MNISLAGPSGGTTADPALLSADAARAGRWLRSWIQPNGAVYGFHNHMVWGSNPGRWGDCWSGHSTAASPVIPALANALGKCPNAQGEELLRTLVRFQATSFQENGNYKHVGFQIGELLSEGLIHNAQPNVMLLQAVIAAPHILGEELCDLVRTANDRNAPWQARMGEVFTTNQEYARIWGQLLYARAFNDTRYVKGALEDIDKLIRLVHVYGLPDEDSAGTLRALDNPDGVEPAEYYGLMLLPLVLAYEMSGAERYLKAAGDLCRHVVRSAWTDGRGCLRMHRHWYRVNGRWTRLTSPMLVCGMGTTLEGLRAYLEHCPDEEIAAGVAGFDAALARYQHPAGFIAPATGWASEIDVAPSSAWMTHDWRYLTRHSEIDGRFWETFWSDYDRCAVLLGEQCLWVEMGPHWAIADYQWRDAYDMKGRKDRTRFGRDMRWVGGPTALPPDYDFALPQFIKLDSRIEQVDDAGLELEVMNLSGMDYAD